MPVSMTATLMPVPRKPSSVWTRSAPVIASAVANSGSRRGWTSGIAMTSTGQIAATPGRRAILAMSVGPATTEMPLKSVV
jgi:hypothetical protein